MTLPWKPLPEIYPSDPAVIRIMREFKRGLLMMEQAQMAEMAAQWVRIERVLEQEMMAIAVEIDRMARAGEMVTRADLLRMDRYKALLAHAAEGLARYTDYADKLVTAKQAQMLELGSSQAVQAVQWSSMDAGIAAHFDRLPTNALENLVGLAGNGSPLRSLFEKSWPDATDGLFRAMVDNMALGLHPVDLARRMADGFGIGLDRAMTIARTEQLRVYREASRQTYEASGVVIGYLRISARDNRVCLGCLLADNGKVYPVDHHFEEHPSGRCTSAPVIREDQYAGLQSGKDWLLSQGEDLQRAIMGPARFDLWKSQGVELDRMVTHKHNRTWGGSYVPTPVRQLQEP